MVRLFLDDYICSDEKEIENAERRSLEFLPFRLRWKGDWKELTPELVINTGISELRWKGDWKFEFYCPTRDELYPLRWKGDWKIEEDGTLKLEATFRLRWKGDWKSFWEITLANHKFWAPMKRRLKRLMIFIIAGLMFASSDEKEIEKLQSCYPMFFLSLFPRSDEKEIESLIQT